MRNKTSQIVKKNLNGAGSGSKTARVTDHNYNSLQYEGRLDKPRNSVAQVKLSFRPGETEKKVDLRRNNSESKAFAPIL